MGDFRVPRSQVLLFLASSVALTGCGKMAAVLAGGEPAKGQETFGFKVTRTLRFPAVRPDGTEPPLTRRNIAPQIIQPCTTSCPSGGGGGTTSTPSYSTNFDGTSGYCYGSNSYCEYYDTAGRLQSQTYLTQNTGGSTSYRYVGPQNTVTGTMPSPFAIASDVDYPYNGWTLHASSATGIVTMTDTRDGNVVYASIDSSKNLTLWSPNQPKIAASLSSLGYSSTLGPQCLLSVAKAAGVSLIAAAVAVAIVLGLCVGDGPFAAFSCGFGWMLAGAVVERASRAAQTIVSEGGCAS